VTTCGLTHFGAPDDEGPEGFGLHGRASHLPAEDISVRQEWRDGQFALEIEGSTRQGRLFGENLRLRRRISTHLGARSLTIDDHVVNEGFRPAPVAVLYHCNLGFPVVSPDSELLVKDRKVWPRDAEAEGGLGVHRRFEPPGEAYAEQVFFHEPLPDASGRCAAAVVNRRLGFGAFLRWRAAELPVLAQWKMMGAGEYVCGLEPAARCGRRACPESWSPVRASSFGWRSEPFPTPRPSRPSRSLSASRDDQSESNRAASLRISPSFFLPSISTRRGRWRRRCLTCAASESAGWASSHSQSISPSPVSGFTVK
jgi:hypothetical protein